MGGQSKFAILRWLDKDYIRNLRILWFARHHNLNGSLPVPLSQTEFLARSSEGNAHPGFHDWHHLISVGAETNTTMCAFLATAAMHASWTNPKLKLAAMRYYNSTIKGLGKAIANGEVDGCEDWVLHATNFLCLFEVR
jgi:hypothetical protein